MTNAEAYLATPEVAEWMDVIVARATPHVEAGVDVETAILTAMEEQTAFISRLVKRENLRDAATAYMARNIYAEHGRDAQ